MTWHASLFTVLAAALAFVCHGATAQEKSPITENTLPIMAWDYADDEATLKSMAECGINLVAFVPPKALDTCKELGLQAIVYHPKLTPARWDLPFKADDALSALPGLIAKYNNHPAVYGYHLKDEPHQHEFAELAKAVAAVAQQAPGKWAYINLLPGTGDPYEQYLESFIQTCKPEILSYDNYPIHENGSFSNGFWTNIAQMRNASLRHDLPFWTIILTAAHFNYAELTPTTLRLQTWGSLAYGARGICYYKFVSRELPILEAPDLGNWRGGPLDPFGEKTPAWDWVKNMNRQLQNVAPHYLKLKSDRVYHIGEVPDHNRGIESDTLIKGFGAGDAFIVGDFTHADGTQWVMIVNKHLQNSVPCLPEFRIPPTSVQYASPITGELKPFPAPWYYLAPGQAVLLKLNTQPSPKIDQ